MHNLTIVPVQGKRMLRQFIHFPLHLYKDCANWVPAFENDEYKTLGPKNPSLTFCERELFLAYRGKEVVGRVAAIVNHKADDKFQEHTVRFGWIDFIEDVEVARLLIDAVVKWGKERGCVKIKGPLGFTDMDNPRPSTPAACPCPNWKWLRTPPACTGRPKRSMPRCTRS